MFRYILILCTVLYFVDVGKAGMLMSKSVLNRGRSRIQNYDSYGSNRRRLGGLSYVPNEEEDFQAERDSGIIFPLFALEYISHKIRSL